MTEARYEVAAAAASQAKGEQATAKNSRDGDAQLRITGSTVAVEQPADVDDVASRWPRPD